VTRTNKILLAVVAAVAALSAFYFLALAPKREQIAKLDGDIAAKQAELEQARQQLTAYEKAKASYKRNYATLARLGKAVPADDDVRSLLVQLESAADRSGVDFEKIELGSGLGGGTSTAPSTTAEKTTGELAPAPGAVPVAGGVLSAMPFNFTFAGGFFDLSGFFARLEHFVTVNNNRLDATGRLLRLESVAIQPAPTGFPHMQAQIGAATYMVPPVEAVPVGAAPGGGAEPASTGTTPPTTSADATPGATG
jgi:hypothetical protein